MNNWMDPDTLAMRSESRAVSVNRIFNFVYGWMAVGLAVSGVVAWFVAQAVRSGQVVLSSGLLMGCCVVEVVMVLGISAAIMKLSPAAAAGLFVGFSAVNGVSLSFIFFAYGQGTIQTAFFISAGMFAGMALIGTVTTKVLDGIGRLCIMGLWGLILASVVNIFMGSSALDYGLSLLGVGVFMGLTAWDAQKVRRLADLQHTMDGVTIRRLGILAALELYLDFINLFIYVLRVFFADRRN